MKSENIYCIYVLQFLPTENIASVLFAYFPVLITTSQSSFLHAYKNSSTTSFFFICVKSLVENNVEIKTHAFM